MPEEKKNPSFVAEWLRGLAKEANSQSQKAVATFIIKWTSRGLSTVISAAAGFLAWLWLRRDDLTAVDRAWWGGVAWTLVAVVVVNLLISGVFALWRYLRRKPPEPPALPEPPVSSDLVKTWRALHKLWSPTFALGCKFLKDACAHAQEGDQLKLSLFARECALEPFKRANDHLIRLLSAPADTVFQADLLEIEQRFQRVLEQDYRRLIDWLEALGESVFGRGGLNNHKGYNEWRSSHTKATDEMQRDRADIGSAADWIDTLLLDGDAAGGHS